MNIDDLKIWEAEETDDMQTRRQRRKRNEAFRRKLAKQNALHIQHRYQILSICAAVVAWTFAGIQMLR